MFISFLLPGVDRGAGPLFHWIMLAQMARFEPEDIVFIGDQAYFDPEHIPFGETIAQGQITFICPDRERFERYRIHVLNSDLLHDLYNESTSHLDVFRRLLTEPVSSLVEAIESALSQFGIECVEAFLSWCNCPSLRLVADKHRIPVIYNELGPLRAPLYRNTVYFDFRGVNGNTTPRTWTIDVLRKQMQDAMPLTAHALRGKLVADDERVRAQFCSDRDPSYALGVALQVEDDSNVVAFGNGWNALRLLYKAVTHELPEQVLVRSHPGAHFIYRGGLGNPDNSEDSLAFLARCKRVIAINSSVLAEAALWGVPFRALGDAPFACLDEAALAMAPEDDRQLWQTAFFLGYLVPAEYLFDIEYYRWRLAAPRSLAECIARHWAAIGDSPGWPALGGDTSVPLTSTPTRAAAAWTSTLALEYRLRKLSAELEQARRMLNEQQALRQEVVRWREEAEKVWNNHEWLRSRLEELQAKALEYPAICQSWHAELERLRGILTEAESRANAERDRAEHLRAELDALRETAAKSLEQLRHEARQVEEALRAERERAEYLRIELEARYQANAQSLNQAREDIVRIERNALLERERLEAELKTHRVRLQVLQTRRLGLRERLIGRILWHPEN